MRILVRSTMFRSCAALMLVAGMGLAAPLARSVEAKASAQRGGEAWRFNDHERQATSDWYRAHERTLPIGVRDRDRFPVDIERRFEIGFVLDSSLRGQIHPVPRELVATLRPAPRGDRYVFVGGHLALIDSRYHVIDIIHIGHDR